MLDKKTVTMILIALGCIALVFRVPIVKKFVVG